MFLHHKPPGLNYLCESVTTETLRYYTTPAGKKYPSASSVTSLLTQEAITRWKERVGLEQANKIATKAANRGTSVHEACELFLNNSLSSMKMATLLPNVKPLFLQLKPALLKHVSSIYCVEQSLYSDTLRIAGKTDGAVLWDAEPTIIDFKTSMKIKPYEYLQHYFLQSTAYALMFTERTGITIKQLVLLIGVDGQSEPQIVCRPIQPYITDLHRYIEQYWSLHPELLEV